MSTSHDGRGRQIARNLTIAVVSAGLAGSAAAMAADSGGTPPPSEQSTKRVAHVADCAKPDPGGKGDRVPLSPDALVKAATITAAHAETIDAVLKEIKNGHAGDKLEGEKPPAAAAAKRAKAARGI
jgi:hypothetical protein